MGYHALKYMFLRRLSRLTVVSAATVTFHRMPPFVSAAAIVVRDGQILMVRDIAQRKLVLPGGHLHWHESVEDGIKREVWEETGYEVAPIRLMATFASDSKLSERGIIRVIMEAEVTGGEQRSSPEGEAEWVSLDSADIQKARDGAIISMWLSQYQESPAARA